MSDPPSRRPGVDLVDAGGGSSREEDAVDATELLTDAIERIRHGVHEVVADLAAEATPPDLR